MRAPPRFFPPSAATHGPSAPTSPPCGEPRSLGRRFADAAARRRRGGFTLLEILIATAVLTIGLVSIVAIFPYAISKGRQVIELSNAVVIAESVAESIREGLRNRKRFVVGSDGETSIYFVFNHDGVKDPIPANRAAEDPSRDYYILLPTYGRSQLQFSGTTEEERRFRALERASKTFVYPETDPNRNGGGDPRRADDDSDDDGDDKFWTLRVEDVYRLGQELSPAGRPPMLKDVQNEVLKQYSYAFAITPSYFDANLSPSRASFQPGGLLFHVRVMIYRAFQITEHTKAPEPIYEIDFEVAL